MNISQSYWRNCSQCKKELAYKAPYYECSVSTCSRKRTGYVFCSILCWEAHVPGANHRNAGAIEKRAPTYEQWLNESTEEVSSQGAEMGQRRIVVTTPQMKSSTGSSSMSQEVLVVVSKMKQYIKDRADMNTSGDVSDVLSDIIRRACDEAIDQARADGRKTVMARDFKSR